MKMCGLTVRSRWTPYLLAFCLLGCFPRAVFAGPAKDDVTPEVQTLFAKAKAAQQQGDSATAIADYQETIKLAPHLAAAYHNLGMLYFNQHDYIDAEEILKRGVELDPDLPNGSAMLGICYFQFGENQKAEPLLRAALEKKPTDDNIEMILVNDLIKLNNYKEAAFFLNDFLARNPKSQEGWYLLGKTYMQMSDDALAKVNEIDPDSVVAHEITGEIDETNHNYDNALLEYKKAIDLAPHEPGTHMHMANIYWLSGKWESAQLEFKAELANDPANCTAHWKLGNAMLEASASSGDAVAELNQAIQRCPRLMQARVDRARALIRMDKQSDALPDLLLAEKDEPSEPLIHFLLATVYKTQGKTAEAQQEMRTYGELQRQLSEAVAAQANGIKTIKNAAH
jgi:tetratricopeptide (TPR) repeat protein